MDKKEIFEAIQREGKKIADAMNLLTEIGQKVGINVEFGRGVTLPELAEMVAIETHLKESCALEVLEKAYEIVKDYGLILDLEGYNNDEE